MRSFVAVSEAVLGHSWSLAKKRLVKRLQVSSGAKGTDCSPQIALPIGFLHKFFQQISLNYLCDLPTDVLVEESSIKCDKEDSQRMHRTLTILRESFSTALLATSASQHSMGTRWERTICAISLYWKEAELPSTLAQSNAKRSDAVVLTLFSSAAALPLSCSIALSLNRA